MAAHFETFLLKPHMFFKLANFEKSKVCQCKRVGEERGLVLPVTTCWDFGATRKSKRTRALQLPGVNNEDLLCAKLYWSRPGGVYPTSPPPVTCQCQTVMELSKCYQIRQFGERLYELFAPLWASSLTGCLQNCYCPEGLRPTRLGFQKMRVDIGIIIAEKQLFGEVRCDFQAQLVTSLTWTPTTLIG